MWQYNIKHPQTIEKIGIAGCNRFGETGVKLSAFTTKKLFGLVQLFFTRKFLLTPPKKAPVLVLDRQSLLKMKEPF